MAREGECYISDADSGLEDKEEPELRGTSVSISLSSLMLAFSLLQSKCIENLDHIVASETDVGHASAKHISTRQTQQLPPESAQRASLEPMDSQLIIPVPTCPPTRRGARVKSTLVCDQKYHSLDDIIRPSQAAKRRSLHGERLTLPDGSNDSASEGSGSDVGSMVGDEDSDDEESRPSTGGRKRKRFISLTPEPTRRSSRRRTQPKVSYDMKIHPQDSDLRRVDACDGSKSSPSPYKQVSSKRNSSSNQAHILENFEEADRSFLADNTKGKPSHHTNPPLHV